MRVHQSQFRPWIDHPGPWDLWRLSPAEQSELQGLIKDAGAAATRVLYARYGRQAELFGGVALVKRMADGPPPVEPLFHSALAILARDAYRARVPLPRPEAGGATNPTNTRRWAVVRGYLLERLRGLLRANAEESLIARAVFARLPEDGLPTGQIARRLRREMEDSGLGADAQLTLELRPRISGGRRWLQAETVRALRAVEAGLDQGDPVLVELLRDPEAPPCCTQTAVVYRLEDSEDGWLSLSCYDPGQGERPLGLRLRSGPDRLRIYETGSGPERPAVQGIRLLALAPARSPQFGLRRYTRWIFPWAALWRLRRRWSLRGGGPARPGA